MNERERGLQPLDGSATGCTLVFIPAGRLYQPMSALAVLAGLHAQDFSGVCECYLRPDVRDGEYLMGVGLALEGKAPDGSWWGAFADAVGEACVGDEDIRLDRGGCQFATVAELRAKMVHAG